MAAGAVNPGAIGIQRVINTGAVVMQIIRNRIAQRGRKHIRVVPVFGQRRAPTRGHRHLLPVMLAGATATDRAGAAMIQRVMNCIRH